MTRVPFPLLAISVATLGAALPAQAACPGSTLAEAHACIEALTKARDAALEHGQRTACEAVQLTIDGVAAQRQSALRYEGTTVVCHVSSVLPPNLRKVDIPGVFGEPGATLSWPHGQAYRPSRINPDGLLPTMPLGTGLDASDLFRGYPAMR